VGSREFSLFPFLFLLHRSEWPNSKSQVENSLPILELEKKKNAIAEFRVY
jgi:hypothetical protein